MSAQPQPLSQFPSLDAWGHDFMRAAVEHPRSRRPLASRINRRIAGPLAIALALPAGAAIAAASGLVELPDRTYNPPPFEVRDDDGPPFELPTPGDVVGYVDLDTGLPILCPDGSPLRQIVEPNGFLKPTPRCSDGSIPEKYSVQQRAWLEELNTGRPDLAVNGPNFQVIVIQGSGKQEARGP